jgi:hypothetical protein
MRDMGAIILMTKKELRFNLTVNINIVNNISCPGFDFLGSQYFL